MTWRPRTLRVSKLGLQPCERCGLHATLRTLDVAVPKAGYARDPDAPVGWAPLIALCGQCWTDIVKMLRDNATPDASGAVSP